MSRRTTAIVKAALSAMHFTGMDGLMAPFTRGAGAILMLHQVSPEPPAEFEPNRILRVTPEFLDQTITQVRAEGFAIVSMDALAKRLACRDGPQRPMIAFTLDDGYKDNLTHALPVFRRHQAPFTVYVPTDYADGKGELWWLALEQAVRTLAVIDLDMDGTARRFVVDTSKRKASAYHTIYWWLRSIDETVARRVVRDLCQRADVNADALCSDLILNWSQLRVLANDPLVTIGGHTRRHYALARLGPGAARAEISEGLQRLERELGRPVRHFSYPFGDEASASEREFDLARSLGLRTAVTTRKGVLQPEHADNPHALPRLSLNGDYQDARYVRVLLSGVPFLLRDAARRLAPVRSPA